jgi:hypothetical protein
MSQENVERVRRGYEALNRGELRPESFDAECPEAIPNPRRAATGRKA